MPVRIVGWVVVWSNDSSCECVYVTTCISESLVY